MSRLKFTLFLLSLILAMPSFAMNGSTTYQARIIKPNGDPLEAVNVNFQFRVLNEDETCTLYVEDYTAINMAQTDGLVAFNLGHGTRSFPTSGVTTVFSNVFDNSISNMPCVSMTTYTPSVSHTRKLVMQFNDGTGLQSLPAMTINAVPYAMYAGKANDAITFNGKADTAFVEKSTLASLGCDATTHAIAFNGVTFSCLAVGSASGTVTSGSVIAALGYTPADPATLSASYASVASYTATTTTINNLSTSLAAITSSQWTTSGTTINYMTGNVGIGTTNPTAKFEVSGTSRFNGDALLGNSPPASGNLWLGELFNAWVVDRSYSSPLTVHHTIKDVPNNFNSGQVVSVKVDPSSGAHDKQIMGGVTVLTTEITNASSYSSLTGNYNLIEHSGPGNVDDITAISAGVINLSSGTVSNVYGIQSYVYNYGGGFTFNSIGADFYSEGGNVVNNYGVKIRDGGTNAVNNYGLYIEDVTAGASSTYNIYSEGNGKNIFMGSIGVGTENPTAALEVSGSARISGTSVLGNTKTVSGGLILPTSFLPDVEIPYVAAQLIQHTLNSNNVSSSVDFGSGTNFILNDPASLGGYEVNYANFNIIQTKAGVAGQYGGIVGTAALAEHDGLGDVGTLTGTETTATNNSSVATVNSVVGLNSKANVFGGSVSTLFGGSFDVAASGAVVSDAYGVHIGNMSISNGASVQSKYGLYISDQQISPASSTTYNIYSEGSGKNVFMGNVGIGTATPESRLEVNGTLSALATNESAPSFVNTGVSYTIPSADLNIRRLTLTDNATVTLPAFTSTSLKMFTLTVYFKQDGVGARTLSLAGSGGDTIKWNTGAPPSISPNIGKTTILQFIKASDESSWYASKIWQED